MLSILLAASFSATPTLAIAYFDDPTNDPELEPIRRGLAQMLITDFKQLPGLEVLERAKLDLVFDELKLWKSQTVDPTTVAALGKKLAATWLLLGSVQQRGKILQIDARVVEVKTGQVLAGKSVEGERAQIFAMEKDVAQMLIDGLALKLSVAERSRLRKTHGKSYDEFVEYTKGLKALDSGDEAGAKKHFENAKGDQGLRAIAYDLAIFKHYTAPLTDEEDADFDEQLKQLDPKGKTLGDAIIYLGHSQYGGFNDPRKVENLIQLAEWVVDRRLSPMGAGNNATAAEPTLLTTLEAMFAADAGLAPLMPGLYEYLLRKYPNDAALVSNAKRALAHPWPSGRMQPGPAAHVPAMKRLLEKIAAQVKQ